MLNWIKSRLIGRRNKGEQVMSYWEEEAHELEVVIDKLMAEIEVLQEENENLRHLAFDSPYHV